MCIFGHWRRSEAADESLESYVASRSSWARSNPAAARVAINSLVVGVGLEWPDAKTLAEARQQVKGQCQGGIWLWLFLQFGLPILLKLVKAWWNNRHAK